MRLAAGTPRHRCKPAVIFIQQTSGALSALDCAADYQLSKSHPEAFLLVAERLGVHPKNCLVFEDTVVDIEATTAAGMASAKVLQPWERTLNR